MRTSLLLALFLAVISTACSKKNSIKTTINPELTGTWIMTERLDDPGDLSGRWRPNERIDYLRFHSDGRVQASDFLDSHLDRYHIVDHQTIIFSSSSNGETALYYYLLSSSQLTLAAQCIEPCGSRFIKL